MTLLFQMGRMKQMFTHLEDKYRNLEMESRRKMDVSDHDTHMKEMRDKQLQIEHKYKVTNR